MIYRQIHAKTSILPYTRNIFEVKQIDLKIFMSRTPAISREITTTIILNLGFRL
jgi:hypothetical protein